MGVRSKPTATTWCDGYVWAGSKARGVVVEMAGEVRRVWPAYELAWDADGHPEPTGRYGVFLGENDMESTWRVVEVGDLRVDPPVQVSKETHGALVRWRSTNDNFGKLVGE